MITYIGIDPGQKGGIAVMRCDRISAIVTHAIDMPGTVRQIVDFLRPLLDVSGGLNPSLTVEKAQAMKKQGVTGTFSYGKHFGIFEAVAACFRVPYHEIPPQRWKRSMGLSKDKRESIRLCEQIYPDVVLVPDRCRVPHDGIAEAVLIAEWGRRQQL